ncbi:TPA: DUF4250 domain-containing protein [Clostridium perfringens]|nr:DUF4250 domain-containing protein [Clostridium perfringens]HBI7010566.1 DUF4250 domain-containing protein [Clostridium perfringens]HBI7168432.1 DUF4250 domain-containing protein [Clostridium perfringens]
MDIGNYREMDPYMLLSIINLKLRDYYSDIESLCDDLEIEKEIIEQRLKDCGYIYNRENNQFVAE